MSVFIELTTDPFEDNIKTFAGGTQGRSERAGMSAARRPLRGIEIKEDTYGLIQVIRSDGVTLPLMDQGQSDGVGTQTSSFLLQSVQEARMEKHQIVETFGEPYIFFFGESPRFLDVQAVLINTNDFNWEGEWWHNWETRLRGTRTVEQNARTYLFYDDTIVEGYMLTAQAVKVSDQPWTVQLSFRMFLTRYRNVSFVGDPNFPIHASVDLPPNINLSSSDAFEQMLTVYENEGRANAARSIQDQEIHDAARQSFGGARRLTDALRTGLRSTAFPTDVWLAIGSLSTNDPATKDAAELFNSLSTRSLRGKINENYDEWAGRSEDGHKTVDGLPPVWMPRWRSIQESQDLFFDAMKWITCLGAQANNESLINLGLKVSFGPNGVRARVTGVQRSLDNLEDTFSPRKIYNRAKREVRSSVRDFLDGDASVGYGDNGQGLGGLSPAEIAATPQNGEDLFYGVGFRAGTQAGLEGMSGGYEYGYTSPFGGAGYGAAGFGDQEGLGYGSSFGAQGDPGHLSPGRFTFAGVADERDAYERFTKPKPRNGIGISIGASVGGNVGIGASVKVGGKISGFGIDVLGGTLNPEGDCKNPDGTEEGNLFNWSDSVSLADLI